MNKENIVVLTVIVNIKLIYIHAHARGKKISCSSKILYVVAKFQIPLYFLTHV